MHGIVAAGSTVQNVHTLRPPRLGYYPAGCFSDPFPMLPSLARQCKGWRLPYKNEIYGSFLSNGAAGDRHELTPEMRKVQRSRSWSCRPAAQPEENGILHCYLYKLAQTIQSTVCHGAAGPGCCCCCCFFSSPPLSPE